MDGAAALRSVWDTNFAAESDILHAIAPHASHVALSVQYPGCPVAQPGTGGLKKYGQLTADERYHMVKTNVDSLDPIQVGLAIRTDDGELVVFEFNLRGFNINSPANLRDLGSIVYLQGRGLDFARLPHGGVEAHRLRSLLVDSGLLQARPSWVMFTGAYHVAYLMKILTNRMLPDSLDAFTALVTANLGHDVYDVKRLVAEYNPGLVRSLRELALGLGVVPAAEEQGIIAGTVAVLALRCFEALRESLNEGQVVMHSHQLCGLQAY